MKRRVILVSAMIVGLLMLYTVTCDTAKAVSRFYGTGKEQTGFEVSIAGNCRTVTVDNGRMTSKQKDVVFNPDIQGNSYITAPINSDIVDILVLGVDRTMERDKTIGIYRADTISVLRINPDSKEIRVLCIPRDTYALIPDENKKDKINHSYAYGSLKDKEIEYTINSVNSFIKYATIEYYFALDMEPVPEIVDSLGGVELDVEIDMKTHGANLSAGLQVLNGKKAFDYIHWRYSGNGDIDRVKRQQKFTRAVFKKLKESGRFTECIWLVWNYRKNVKTNLTLKQLLSLTTLAGEIDDESVKYNMIPGRGEYIDKISYWIPDVEKTDKLLREFFSK